MPALTPFQKLNAIIQQSGENTRRRAAELGMSVGEYIRHRDNLAASFYREHHVNGQKKIAVEK